MAVNYVTDQIYLNSTHLSLSFLTLLAIISRVYVRITLQGNSVLSLDSWRWSDRLIVITWVGYTSCGIINLFIFAGLGFTPQNIADHAGEPGYMIGKRLGYAFLVTFWVWMFTIKGAWLCFFDEFIRKDALLKSWLAVRVLGFLVAFAGASTFVYSNVWCLPIKRQWSTGEDFCWLDTKARYKWMYWRQVWHAGLDLLILAIPLSLLSLLHNVPLHSRVHAAIMFALGILCTAISVVYLAFVLIYDDGRGMSHPIVMFLEFEPIVELAAAILIQCLPAVRVLLTERGREMRSGRSERRRRRRRGSRGGEATDVVEVYNRGGGEKDNGGDAEEGLVVGKKEEEEQLVQEVSASSSRSTRTGRAVSEMPPERDPDDWRDRSRYTL